LSITTEKELILDGGGDEHATFVIQMGSTFIMEKNAKISLINGAQAQNVFFRIGSSATISTGSRVVGTMVAYASISFGLSTKMYGRALAGAAVSFDGGGVNELPGQVSTFDLNQSSTLA
jgi:hypothetical protein